MLYHLHRIKSIRRSLPTSTAIQLVNCFVIARVDYCNSIVSGIPKYQHDRIQSVLNAAARLIFGVNRYDHITPLLKDRLHCLRVPQRIDFKQSLLVYKALHDLAPAYIADYCVNVSSNNRRSSLRSATHKCLVIPPPAKTAHLSERSFRVSGPSLRNTLPDNVKDASSVDLFKTRLKTFLFGLSYN